MLMATCKKRKRDIVNPQENKQTVSNDIEFVLALPSLERVHGQPEPLQPPPKKRRRSSRIEAAGPRRKYIEQEIDELIEYEFQLEKMINFNHFIHSNILKRYNLKTITDAAELERLFKLFFIGMHIDFQDDHHEWFEGIIKRVKILQRKTRTKSTNNHTLQIFDRFNIKLLVHLKHFSAFWDQWISLPSNRIAVLRTYSHAYDACDNTKPLTEILRELDSEQIVSIDFMADELRLDRQKFIKFVNNDDSVDFDSPSAMSDMVKWAKSFLQSNAQIEISDYRICKEHFVKPGSEETKTKDIVFEVILPSTMSIKLETMSVYELSMIQDVVIDKLRNKSDYQQMCQECEVPVVLFQEIAFGITLLLPRFIIDRMIDWSKGIHVDDIDLAVKEERLFFVKVE